MPRLSLDVRAEAWPIQGRFAIARGSKTRADVVVARLDNGMGCGECTPYARYVETIESVLAEIEAARAAIESGCDRDQLQRLMAAGAARNAIDCALWDLQAKRTMIMWTSTTGEEGVETLFDRSLHPEFIAGGCAFTVLMFAALSALGLPTMMVYGVARGLGHMPHGVLMELFGAMLARLYLHRRFGRKPFLRMAPVLLAGYFVGTGLVGMACVAIRLITSAISRSPF